MLIFFFQTHPKMFHFDTCLSEPIILIVLFYYPIFTHIILEIFCHWTIWRKKITVYIDACPHLLVWLYLNRPLYEVGLYLGYTVDFFYLVELDCSIKYNWSQIHWDECLFFHYFDNRCAQVSIHASVTFGASKIRGIDFQGLQS